MNTLLRARNVGRLYSTVKSTQTQKQTSVANVKGNRKRY